MTDITTAFDRSANRLDWISSGGLLQQGRSLETAIYLSLFTDRVAADADTIPDGTTDGRGWWGDNPDSPIGSRLWLLDRSKQTPGTLTRAQDYIAEALQWLIDDNVVAGFEVRCEWTRPKMLGAQVTAVKPDGSQTTLNYEWAWSDL